MNVVTFELRGDFIALNALIKVTGLADSGGAAKGMVTEGNVRVLHLRARRAMSAYDRTRSLPSERVRERHRAILHRFLSCLATQDVAGLELLLAESVRTATDSAGEYSALLAPLGGRRAVARFYVQAAANRAPGGPSVEVRTVNGLPAYTYVGDTAGVVKCDGVDGWFAVKA